MATSSLVLHRGARPVAADELAQFKPPAPEGRWFPVGHGRVLETVTRTLADAGYVVRRQQLGLTRDAARFFGTLDLETPVVPGVSLAVGVRNSVDKSFPLGFCAGNRVFVCDNLAFRSELLVRRKHTLHGERNFTAAIARAVTDLGTFKEAEAERVQALMRRELADEQADSLILRAWECGIVGARDLPRILLAWREPAFEEFAHRTAWSLLNAFTAALADRAHAQPAAFALQTIRLNAHLDDRHVQCAAAV
jgi:hypothetical protein